MENKYCPICKTLLYPTYNFCPQCGFNIKQGQTSPSTSKQIGIYLLSFFLPPLGLWPGIKLLMQNNDKSKKVGFIAIFLTAISIIISLWITFGVFKTLETQVSPQYNASQIQELGL